MKKSKKRNLFPYIYLAVTSIIILIPFYYMLQRSFEEKGFQNYIDVFKQTGILINFANSTIISILTILSLLVITVLAAYAFSKLHFRFKNILYVMLISGLMIVPAIVVLPVYKIMVAMKLTGSIMVVVLPYVGLWFPLSLILMKNYMDDIPKEISESAYIDGCSVWRILLSIIIPISKPIITAVVVVIFLNTWNELFYAFIMLRREEMKTLATLPTKFISQFRYQTRLVFAVLVLIEIPVVLVFIFLNKYIKAGLVAGAIKG